MRWHRTAAAAVLLVLVAGAPSVAAGPQDVLGHFATIPLHFEENDGRYPQEVSYVSRGAFAEIHLAPNVATVRLSDSKAAEDTVLRLRLVAANAAASPEAVETLPGRANYLLGRDACNWRTNIPMFGRVRFRDVYPGVDIEYYGNQGKLEFDFVVAAGADPGRIVLDGQGAGAIARGESGALLLHANGHTLELRAPVAYQSIEGGQRAIPATYIIDAEGRIRISLGEYDREAPLIIDPVVAFSSCVGVPEPETRGVGVDRDGNMYLAGYTTSPALALPGTHYDSAHNGSLDIFLVKFDPAGKTILYSTYIGGGDKDSCKAMTVSPDGCAYLTGSTKSADFPISAGGINHPHATYDVFALKVNQQGDGLDYSCRFGGSSMEEARGITVDAAGNCTVVGGTHSPEFPTTAGSFQPAYTDPPEETPEEAGSFVNGEDAFIAKINPAGTAFVFSTFLGGHGFEKAWAVATDAAGDIYVAGHVEALDFPMTDDAFQDTHGGGTPRSEDQYGPKDGFVAKLSADGGQLLASTYFGGAGQDVGYGIGVDAFGNVFVAGNTDSADLPVYRAAYPVFCGGDMDVFVAKLDNRLSQLAYSTYLGGAGHDELASDAFGVDRRGFACAAGFTSSADFPVTADAFVDSFCGGASDACVLRLAPEGVLDYATLLGGAGADKCGDLAVDAAGNIYVCGNTDSSDFAVERAYRSGGVQRDAFVAKVVANAPRIAIDGDFSDWEEIPAYTDAVDDTHDTDHSLPDDIPAYVAHPDADLVEYRFTHDDENLYAYFRATGVIGRTQTAAQGRAGRYYVIATIDVDDDISTGYWLHEGGYYPTSGGYDMNMEVEFYDGAFNTGHYLNHGCLNEAEFVAAQADQSMGIVDVRPGTYDWYTQWVWWDEPQGLLEEIVLPEGQSIVWVTDRGPAYQGIIRIALSPDGHEAEMVAPFRGFMKHPDGTPIVRLGRVLNVSFSLEASGELAPGASWASDTAAPLTGYVLEAQPQVYSLITAVDGEGDVSPAPGFHAYDEGALVALTAAPAEGWVFSHWQGAATGTANPLELVMDGDKAVTAVFEPATVPGDIDGDGMADAVDIQLVINAVLGLPVPYDCDMNASGTLDAVDVQLVINAALGL